MKSARVGEGKSAELCIHSARASVVHFRPIKYCTHHYAAQYHDYTEPLPTQLHLNNNFASAPL